MITKKDLKDYDFNSMDDFYNYIIESKENGQFTQVKELINQLSTKQYFGFLEYLSLNNIKLDSHFLRDKGL